MIHLVQSAAETFLLVILVVVGPNKIAKVEAPFDTKRDCVTASRLFGPIPMIYSTECITITTKSGRKMNYRIESGA